MLLDQMMDGVKEPVMLFIKSCNWTNQCEPTSMHCAWFCLPRYIVIPFCWLLASSARMLFWWCRSVILSLRSLDGSWCAPLLIASSRLVSIR